VEEGAGADAAVEEHPAGAAAPLPVAMGAPSTRARAKHAAAVWLLRPQRAQWDAKAPRGRALARSNIGLPPLSVRAKQDPMSWLPRPQRAQEVSRALFIRRGVNLF
jgi:hypothetical protein